MFSQFLSTSRIHSQYVSTFPYALRAALMPLIDDAVRKIRGIEDVATKEKYVRALRSSMVWDGVEDDRKPTSASSVAAANGLGPDNLENNHVLLSKKDVAKYATEHGAERSLASIRKNLTGSKYQKHFGDDRPVVRNGKKLLITYAEARSMLGIGSKGAVPNI